jgi:hypothetical protein
VRAAGGKEASHEEVFVAAPSPRELTELGAENG